MVIVLALIQPMAVYADSNVFLTVQQVSDLMDGMESITVQLQNLGLDMAEVKDVFDIEPRETSFYANSYVVIPYSGEFVTESQNEIPSAAGLYDYDGNPPTSVSMQEERIKSIFGIATQYYKTNYYEGLKEGEKGFGNYMTYLYISNYIDGPGRAPNANDFPYIISGDDIRAYDTFLRTSNLSSVLTGVADFGVAMYGTIDYARTINSVNTVDQMINQAAANAIAIGINESNIEGAIKTIAPLVESNIVKNYKTSANESILTEETIDYVESQLTALNFYDSYDKNTINSIIGIFTSLFIGIISSSLSIMGVIISAVPLFTYEFTTLLQTAVLVTLGYSFSGRYAVRTGIYLGM